MITSSNLHAVIGFYGYSNSGKTSLINKLIQELKQCGYTIAVIKCTNKNISSESSEKDTSGFRAAGAKMTSFSSTSETNFVIPKKLSVFQIIEKIRTFMDVDLFIVEGANEADIPKIRLGEIEERENTIYTYGGDFNALSMYILKIVEEK